MLQVDLDAPDSAIEQFVGQKCSEVGRVISVTVYRSPSPFALIEMARREQVHQLTSKLGGSEFGTQAIVRLEQITNKAILPLPLSAHERDERRQLGDRRSQLGDRRSQRGDRRSQRGDRRSQQDRRMVARPAQGAVNRVAD